MSIDKLIDTIIKDRMLTCQCTDDGRVCMRCQYEALKQYEDMTINLTTNTIDLKGNTLYVDSTVNTDMLFKSYKIGNCTISPLQKHNPTFERVPEGVFRYGKYSRDLYYPFGVDQILAWDNSCYCVYRDCCKEAHIPFSPYLIPTTFGELKPGEWYRYKGVHYLVIDKNKSVLGCRCGEIQLLYPSDNLSVLKVSEVLP